MPGLPSGFKEERDMTATETETMPGGPDAVPVKFAPPQFAAAFEQAASDRLQAETETELMAGIEEMPCYLLNEDGEPRAVRQFYMVEDDTGEGTWVLRRRTTESGFGSPFLWADRNQVAEQLRAEAIASGCFGESRVITIHVTHRDPPEILCVYCKEWGHLEDECEVLEDDGKGIVRRRAGVSDIEVDLARSAQGLPGGPA